MITTEELASIRAAAIGDMLGDSKALDKMGPAATVFRLCRELERLERAAAYGCQASISLAYPRTGDSGTGHAAGVVR